MTYASLKKVYKLDIIQCQSGNFNNQCNFRTILLWLHDGESTVDN